MRGNHDERATFFDNDYFQIVFAETLVAFFAKMPRGLGKIGVVHGLSHQFLRDAPLAEFEECVVAESDSHTVDCSRWEEFHVELAFFSTKWHSFAMFFDIKIAMK